MTKHPFSLNELFQIKRIANATPSPDGLRIVFDVSEHSVDQNTVNTQLWMIPSHGGVAHQWTHQGSKNRAASWSPSGQWIAFESNRNGTMQVWIMPVNGGDARQITHFALGASKPTWGADDRHLWVVSQQSTADHGPNHIADKLLFRHWDSWCDATRNRIFCIDIETGVSTPETPVEVNCPPVGMEGDQDFAVSPDGTEFVYVHNIAGQAALMPNNSLFRRLSDGQAERIGHNDACESDPRYSPTGRYLSWLGMERPGYESDRRQIFVLDRQTNHIRSLTADLDLPIVRYFWSRSGDTIYFDALDKGRRTIFRVGLDGRTHSVIYRGETLTLCGELDGGALLVGKDNLSSPLDLYRLEQATNELTAITTFNPTITTTVDWAVTTDIWFTGAEGDSVHGFLLRPPDALKDGAKHPLLLWIHGGPQSAFCDQFHYRWNPQVFVGAGYAVFMVNPRGSTSYGQWFTDQIRADWGGKVVEDILAGVDAVLTAHPEIDGDRIAAAGGSFGGYMVNWLQGHNNRFRAFICHAGIFNLWNLYYGTEELWFPEWEFLGTAQENPDIYDQLSPCRYVQSWNTPMLILHGELDYRVPVVEGIGAFTALQRRGIDSRLVIFPEEGHWIMRPKNSHLWYSESLSWLAKHI